MPFKEKMKEREQTVCYLHSLLLTIVLQRFTTLCALKESPALALLSTQQMPKMEGGCATVKRAHNGGASHLLKVAKGKGAYR